MIILDLNHTMYATILIGLRGGPELKIDENLIRHMVLNSIRACNLKFKQEYGELVIACDGTNYWRKTVFPYYKSNRKKVREASLIDWKTLFSIMNKICLELKENFPYRVLQIETAEADDVIAALIMNKNVSEKILIISSDKDFVQLQRYDNVSQFDNVRKKFINVPDSEVYLLEHIIRGDAGDGIPNILTNDDVFVTGQRQKRISTKKVENWVLNNPEDFCDNNMLRNFKRNEQLIDLRQIPLTLTNNILKEYESQANKQRNKMFNYFVEHKLKNLIESIQEF